MRRGPVAAAILALLLGTAPARPGAAQGAPTVATDRGPVTGAVEGPLTKYLGIPYAAPPVGALRWRPPQPPAAWSTPRSATAFGPRCPQTAVVGEFSAPSATEDCLFLNVFAPSRPAPAGGRPVMVWIPGGGFFAGAADDYDPAALIGEGEVIVVSLNYRVGVLGFLAQTDLDAEGHPAGNYGLLDQQMALRWVRANIAAFGGDPGNVTIFGESAGAISVHGHLTSPDSQGLFHRAILESGFTRYAPSPLANPRSVITPLAGAIRYGDGFAAAMGCTTDVPACLRRLPVAAIIERQMPFVAGLITGATGVPPDLRLAIGAADLNRVPVINGTNRDEWRWPAARTELRTGRPLTAEGYAAALRDFFGELAPRVAAEYAPGSSGSPSEALAAAETDAYFACGALRDSVTLARAVPVYGYEFNVTDAPMYMPAASFPYGAAHTAELQFVFPLFHGGSGAAHPLTPEQGALARTMARYWTNFARSGDPNGADLPPWPRLTPTGEVLLSLEMPRPAPLPAATFAARHHCAFWAALLP